MDGQTTPENEFEILAGFTPEMWSHISCFLPGEQIGRLKMTGSKQIWSRLTVPYAVTTINLGQDWLVFKRWPAFLDELPTIQEFSIRNKNEVWWNHWQPKVSHLPKTIRKLTIEVVKSESFFISNDVPLLPISDYLPQLESLSSSNCHWIPDMGQLPETLTSLQLDNYLEDVSLPASLIHFGCAYFVTSPARTKSQSATNSSPRFAFPPQLLSINSSFLDVQWFISDGGKLPQSLVTLKNCWFEDPRHWTCSESLADLIPPKITDISIWVPHPLWVSLPQTLTRARLCFASEISPNAILSTAGNTIHNVNTASVYDLPKSITALELSDFKQIGFQRQSLIYPALPSEYGNRADQSYFPPFLTELSINFASLTVEASKVLPRSLTRLDISNLDGNVCKHLPRGITQLSATRVMISPDLIDFLPESLTELQMTIAQPEHAWIDPCTGMVASVQQMISERGSIHSVEFFCRPLLLSSLAQLKIISNNPIKLEGGSFPIAHLEKLKHLKIPFYVDIPHFILHVPRALLTMKLPEDTESVITGQHFKYLPRTLLKLCSLSPEIYDEDIPHLPPKLEVLSVLNAVNLTNSCIKHLPRTLQRFEARKNERITASAIPDLPYLLRYPQSKSHVNKFRTAYVIIDNRDTHLGSSFNHN